MAEEDDDLPRALRPKPTDLDVMGIEELNEYIAELEAEIERVRSAIVKKEQQRIAASAVFKS
ncbi:MAG: DUF1192 domain-containing protein [Pseudomonadota bacterium]|jgi:uncharacterized small protein (DUF1192 family)|nr:DUF1192 domain-containing protein [Rhodospirillaceae bacterium]MEC7656238.1 DUF1192 domain-containing protein [Pseudomonadota bacterium]MEC8369827.1 DUF1192 domain-containing protein [Pseudomonadota bacterium]MED5573038.1 DUF1192 domain-containing protein [Pseudomonadota bacterium]|tara:strand:+ start:1353 stop:1538 length:186 start_codon:yes stop_codon:yes gene_type:complete